MLTTVIIQKVILALISIIIILPVLVKILVSHQYRHHVIHIHHFCQMLSLIQRMLCPMMWLLLKMYSLVLIKVYFFVSYPTTLEVFWAYHLLGGNILCYFTHFRTEINSCTSMHKYFFQTFLHFKSTVVISNNY